jgi:hypothetical protein
MKALKQGGMAVACAASVVLSSLTLFLCSAWLLSSVSLVQSLTLTAMSVCGSGVVALIEFRSSSTARCRAQREALKSDCNIPARQDIGLNARSAEW